MNILHNCITLLSFCDFSDLITVKVDQSSLYMKIGSDIVSFWTQFSNKLSQVPVYRMWWAMNVVLRVDMIKVYRWGWFLHQKLRYFIVLFSVLVSHPVTRFLSHANSSSPKTIINHKFKSSSSYIIIHTYVCIPTYTNYFWFGKQMVCINTWERCVWKVKPGEYCVIFF